MKTTRTLTTVSAALLGLLLQVTTGAPFPVPTIDLAAETQRQVIVDREAGQYLGHPTIRAKAPHATFLWASSTPVTAKGKPGELDVEINPIIVEHNRLAAKVMAELKIPVNDLYAAVANRLELARGDQFHWQPEGTSLLKDAVVATLQRELKARAKP